MLFVLMTAVGIIFFPAGVWSLLALNQLGKLAKSELGDSFNGIVGLLFTTEARSPEFKELQKRTIWLLCLSMLLLILASYAVTA